MTAKKVTFASYLIDLMIMNEARVGPLILQHAHILFLT